MSLCTYKGTVVAKQGTNASRGATSSVPRSAFAGCRTKLTTSKPRQPSVTFRRCGRAGGVQHGQRQTLVVRAGEDVSPEYQEEITPTAKAWSLGTVMENKAGTADGSLRILKISVADQKEYLEGVRFKEADGRLARESWISSFSAPGQHVGLSLVDMEVDGGRPPAKPITNWTSDLFPISCSPYQARSQSAALDASIIEILVDSAVSEMSSSLAGLAPGDQVHVSSVVGSGFVSMFNPKVGLNTSMEEGLHLVMVASGPSGMAAVHSALAWTPVQAHAGGHQVTVFYEVDSVSAAAYVAEWDAWREAGIRVVPFYKEEGRQDGARLIEGLFEGPGGFAAAISSDPEQCAVLVAGTKGLGSVALMKMLTNRGVKQERVLYCDFF